MASKKEVALQQELKKSFEAIYPEDHFWLKIPDAGNGGRSFVKRAFDMHVLVGGVALAIETKVYSAKTTKGKWAIADVQTHQLENLEKYARAKGRAFVLLLHRVGRDRHLWVIPLLSVRNYYDRRMLPEELPGAWEIQRLKYNGEMVWDVSALLDDISPAHGLLHVDGVKQLPLPGSKPHEARVQPLDKRKGSFKIGARKIVQA